MMRPLLARHRPLLLLFLILAVALSLRLFGQNWDQGTYQHPDERFIAMVSADRVSMPGWSDPGEIFSPSTSTLNPRRDDANGNPMSFAYGTLPLYVQGTVSAALNTVSDNDWGSYAELYRVGRSLTALIDTMTVAVIFLIGRRLFGLAAGLIASTLYTFAVLAIQLGHFFAVDSWLTLFVTLALYFTIRFIDRPTLGRSLAIGAVLGLAFATKASVPSVLVPVAFGYLYVFWTSPRRPDILVSACIGALLSLAVFTLFEPYALVRSGPFIEDVRTQARIVRGQNDIPFTRQFVRLTPGVYELRNLFAYTIGPGFLLGAVAGTIFAVRQALASRGAALGVPVLWVLAYIPILLSTEARFLRYSLPLLPVLAIFTAGFLVWLIAHPHLRLAGQIATILILAVTIVWAAGFMTIYSHEHPRISASRWIHENIPPGSVLSAESWDDPLPNRYPNSPPLQYDIRTLDIYGDRPPEEKVDYLYEALQDVEYVILSSNRLVDSVDNLPWRYAVQNEYYRRLENGQLGYRLVYEGLVRPELFGVAYDDRGADESFTVYDHPHVRIYERVDDLNRAEFRQRLLWGIEQPWIPQRHPTETWLMLDEPVSEIDTAGYSDWNTPATHSGIVAALSWLIAIEVIGICVLPLAARMLHRSPDRGAFSARLLGIIIIGWVVWIGASIGFWPASIWTIMATTLALAALSWGSLLRHGSASRRHQLPSLSTYLSGAAIFGSLFGLFLLFRAVYPDYWQTYFGGEKPFELAYLRAVTNSTEFPPYDPWYADGFINYYYYGWHLISTIIRLSGVGISSGFQLAAATFAALLGLQSFAVTGLLVRRGRGLLRGAVPVAGFLTLFLVLFAGNFDGVRQVAENRLAAGDEFDFWRSTRVIDYTINEFPYFSQIWADVHPHVINLPIYLLLLTLVVHVVIATPRSGRPVNAPTGSMLMLPVIALVLGTMSVTNSWDAPLAVGLTTGAFLYAGLLRGGRHWISGLGMGVLVIASALVLFSPFYTRFYSVVEGVEVTTQGSPIGQFLTHWALMFLVITAVIVATALRRGPWRSGGNAVMLTAAITLAGGGASGLIQIVRGTPPNLISFTATLLACSALIVVAAFVARPDRLPLWLISPILLMSGITGILAPVRPSAAVATALATVGAMFALRHWRSPVRFVPWALVTVACITIAAVEIVYVADDLRNSPWERMNTVFKFYLQAWLLVGVSAAILLSRFLQKPASRLHRSRAAVILTNSALGIVVVAGLIYPLLGTPVRLAQAMPSTPGHLTLDGYAWMKHGLIRNGTGETISFSGDLEAIRWLERNAGATDVILEAAIGPYRGNGSRISSATGLPAVLGWDRHQRQQRYEPDITKRMRDVQSIYNETDHQTKLDQLYCYNVRFVIVGDVERYWNTPDEPQFYASEAGLAAFDDLVGAGLNKVFESNGTAIYEVEDFPRLPAAP